jgi:nucleotide-binding universal stress UspA family protein
MTGILACLDPSLYGASVCEHTAWAARQLGDPPVQLLHVLQREAPAPSSDRSGRLGVDSSDELLRELAELDATRARLAQKQGRALLEDAAARLRAAGVSQVSQVQRHGMLVDAVIELEREAALVILGKRGMAADMEAGHLGANLERVVRASTRPVLVANRAFQPITRYVLAFDGGPAALRAVDYVGRAPLVAGLECHLVSVVAPGASSRTLDQAADMVRRQGVTVQASLLHGEPEEAIAAYAAAAEAQLLVMGAYGHSRIRNLLVGSTTTALLRACRIPVLVFR